LEGAGGRMIFKDWFIDLIISGKKTQTRRPNRGYYEVGKTYAIQPCRTCPGLIDYRIKMDAIWEEVSYKKLIRNGFDTSSIIQILPISVRDANEEGYISTVAFEEAFRELYSEWDGDSRWAYGFHVVEEGKEEKK
jgi:hypothetical protein